MPQTSVRGRPRPPSVRHGVDPFAIVTRLAPSIRWPGASDVGERSWRLVALTSDFDAWVIAWPRGGRVELHDHGRSSGALVVLEGALVETTPWRDDTGQLLLQQRDLGTGAALRFPRGHVHDVTNATDAVAVSLHVYHPPLTTMTHYDLAGNQLVPRRALDATAWAGEAAQSGAQGADPVLSHAP